MRRHALLAVFMLHLPACGELREPTPPRTPGPQFTYLKDIRPLLEKRCVSCHGPQQRSGSYDVSTYVGVLEPGADETPNTRAGDAGCLFLAKLDGKDAKHWEYLLPQPGELKPGEDAQKRREDDRAMLRRWIIDDLAAYFDVAVHPPGWLYALSRDKEDFHGGYLRKREWKLDNCRACHGADLRGGVSAKSCETCHTGGPEGCTTCHGATRQGTSAAAPPPDLAWSFGRAARGVGAHVVHLSSKSWRAALPCESCHKVPATLRDAGHLDDQDLRAEVSFSGIAATAPASYDRANLTCNGIYCHGGPMKDPTASHIEPKWNQILQNGMACNNCHGMPGKGIGGPECDTCHQQSVAACPPGSPGCITTGKRARDGREVGIRFISPSLHMDGKAPLGKAGAGPCTGCHGTTGQGAPPPGVHGDTVVSSPGVGLHDIHLKDNPFSKGVACGECHVIPKQVNDKGHVDSDLPAEVTFGPLSRGQTYAASVDTKPTYDPTTQSCKNAYCHSLSGGELPAWAWTQPISLTCTSCHGSPPTKLLKGGDHPATTVGSCGVAGCHFGAYDSTGQLDRAKHINGKVDL